MNPQNNPNWKRRLQELEQEINQSTFGQTKNQEDNLNAFSEHNTQISTLQTKLNQVQIWFNNLPRGAQVIVGLVAIVVGFSLLNTVLQVVTSLLSIAILAILLYCLYKFFVASQSPE